MNKEDKKIILLIQKLKEQIKKNFGKRCKEVYINCPSCTAFRLFDYLLWYENEFE